MLRTIQHINRTLLLIACSLTVWGSSALYASSPIEFCIDTQGRVHIIATAEGVTGNKLTTGAHFHQGFDAVVAISTTEHHNSAGTASVQLINRTHLRNTPDVPCVSVAYIQAKVYLFYSDLPPPSAIGA